MIYNYRLAWSTMVFLVLVCSVSLAQDDNKKDDKPPPPKDITLETKDGMSLHGTYFPSRKGKEAVPVILLHGYGGSQQDMANLAKSLHAQGHAVVICDLRGHGASTKLRLPNGDLRDIKFDDLRPNDFKTMVNDVEALKSFLLQENNNGKLNIEMLTVVGAELGAVLALNWAVVDWSWPQLPAYKQGQDVKALVLISPKQSIQGLSVAGPLRLPVIREHLSMMVVGGTQSRDFTDVRRLYNSLKRFHPTPPQDLRAEQQDLFLVDPATNLEGAQLLDAEGLDIHGKIIGFINLRLVNKLDRYPWAERRSPLGGS
jgi:pimeloyl-ACP methyl ester carboxylesterase